jgi:hypothetical protein
VGSGGVHENADHDVDHDENTGLAEKCFDEAQVCSPLLCDPQDLLLRR